MKVHNSTTFKIKYGTVLYNNTSDGQFETLRFFVCEVSVSVCVFTFYDNAIFLVFKIND